MLSSIKTGTLVARREWWLTLTLSVCLVSCGAAATAAWLEQGRLGRALVWFDETAPVRVISPMEVTEGMKVRAPARALPALAGVVWAGYFSGRGQVSLRSGLTRTVGVAIVGDHFFRVLKQRQLGHIERLAPDEAVVSKELASELCPNGCPAGQAMEVAGRAFRVVAVWEAGETWPLGTAIWVTRWDLLPRIASGAVIPEGIARLDEGAEAWQDFERRSALNTRQLPDGVGERMRNLRGAYVLAACCILGLWLATVMLTWSLAAREGAIRPAWCRVNGLSAEWYLCFRAPLWCGSLSGAIVLALVNWMIVPGALVALDAVLRGCVVLACAALVAEWLWYRLANAVEAAESAIKSAILAPLMAAVCACALLASQYQALAKWTANLGELSVDNVVAGEVTAGVNPSEASRLVREMERHEAVAVTSGIPLLSGIGLVPVTSDGGLTLGAIVRRVNHHYVAVLGLRLREGEAFPPDDTTSRVALVNRAFEEQTGEGRMVGRQIAVGRRQYRVVGVVADHSEALGTAVIVPTVLLPFHEDPQSTFTVARVNSWRRPLIANDLLLPSGITVQLQPLLVKADRSWAATQRWVAIVHQASAAIIGTAGMAIVADACHSRRVIAMLAAVLALNGATAKVWAMTVAWQLRVRALVALGASVPAIGIGLMASRATSSEATLTSGLLVALVAGSIAGALLVPVVLTVFFARRV